SRLPEGQRQEMVSAGAALDATHRCSVVRIDALDRAVASGAGRAIVAHGADLPGPLPDQRHWRRAGLDRVRPGAIAAALGRLPGQPAVGRHLGGLAYHPLDT